MSSERIVLGEIELPELRFLRRGKVRDLYEVDKSHLLLVATDRISAFDCVLPNPIPHKGAVLTQISAFWFRRFSALVKNHLVTTQIDEFPEELLARLSRASRQAMRGRTMLVRRTDVVPFECVVRGFLAGSGWKEYQKTQAICGHALPAGLVESDQLPEAIFTPATKAESGHDINVSVAEMAGALGHELTDRLQEISLRIYRDAAAFARSRGILICDTKFEFGILNGEIRLIDEVLTPDSSRFWPQDSYEPGGPQASFDKQFVRDYLETLDWDKRPPAPALPAEVIAGTSARYLDAYRLITGKDLDN